MSLRDYREFEKLTNRISKAIQAGSVSHAYILEGDSCVDKEGFARNMAKAILCKEMPGTGCDECLTCRKLDHDNYEDLYVVRADESSVKNVMIEKLQEHLKKKPVGERNIAIICDADLMTDWAQNRLLKTLEEPNPGTVIFLLSENTENLLQTILSRCIIYRLGNYAVSASNPAMEVPEKVFGMVMDGEYFFEIKKYLDKKLEEKKDALAFLDGMERLYRELLVRNGPSPVREEKIIEGINYLEEARRDLLANVNYKYAIRNLVLKIGG